MNIITGVIQSNNAMWLHEDCDNGIDLTFETHIKEYCPTYKDHEYCDCIFDGCNDYLIGFVWNEATQQYEIDKQAEYSAIVNGDHNTTQVIHSKWAIKCNRCSPCYPGQGDIDTPGDLVAYCLPPDVIGDEYPEVTNRIFKL